MRKAERQKFRKEGKMGGREAGRKAGRKDYMTTGPCAKGGGSS